MLPKAKFSWILKVVICFCVICYIHFLELQFQYQFIREYQLDFHFHELLGIILVLPSSNVLNGKKYSSQGSFRFFLSRYKNLAAHITQSFVILKFCLSEKHMLVTFWFKLRCSKLTWFLPFI